MSYNSKRIILGQGGGVLIGLKRGEVKLCDYETLWTTYADELICKLNEIFKGTAIDIQHVGSTAIHHIKAKPMIDIAIGVKCFEDLDDIFKQLKNVGIYKSSLQSIHNTILCAVKNDRDSDICLAVPHIVIINSAEWNDLTLFRDYMNEFPEKAKEYEKIKISQSRINLNNRNKYLQGKQLFVTKMIAEALSYYKIKQN